MAGRRRVGKALRWLSLTWTLLVTVAADERFIIELTDAVSVQNAITRLPEAPPPCLQGAIPTVGTIYDSNPLFSGFSVHIRSQDASRPSGHQQQQYAARKQCLESLDGVTRVWASQTYKLASSSTPEPPSDASPGRFNTSVFHELTGVNALHARGVTGRGAVVAVLDTGVDYLHPALGGGFGPGYRVRFGFDFVGDGYRNGGRPVEGPDPYTECHYHGTHVSGIVGGNHPEVGFVGVAPNVTLEMYRCTGCSNQPINSEVVIKAALKAHERGVDVISASIALEEGAYADDPLTEVLSRIAEHGRTVVVVAAANWGWAGTFSVAAPAAARGVLIVGAVNAQHVHRYAPRARFEVLDAEDDDNHTHTRAPLHTEDFAWAPAPPSRFPDSIPLRALSLNTSTENDACTLSTLPQPRPDFQGAVVLLRRGGCDFADKMATIKAAGAEYALVYDDKTEEDDEPWDLVDADNKFEMHGVGFISASTGARLVQALSAGSKVMMRLDSNFTQLPPYISPSAPNPYPPGQIAPRGTWGPDGELGLIPSLVAPGIGITSTFPRSWGGYKVLSGTSMAAPYVAGCVALMRELHPDMPGADIVRRLMSTARPVNFHDGALQGGAYDFLAPTYKQGAGLVDCFAAATTTTQVSTPALALSDAEHLAATHEFHVINVGATDAVFSISHMPAASVDALSPDRGRIVPMTLAYTDNIASAEFLETLRPNAHVQLQVIEPPPGEQIRLAPGTEALVRLSFDISSFDPGRCPLYGGFVSITQVASTDDEGKDIQSPLVSLSVPYAGVACHLREVPVLQPQAVNPANFTFVTAATAQDPLGGPYAAAPIRPFHLFTVPGPPCGQEEEEGEADGEQCLGTRHQQQPLLETLQFPTVSLSLSMQSRAVSITLVPAGPSSTTATGRRRHAGEEGEESWPAFAAAATTAHPGGFSRVWTKYFTFTGQLGDGAWAPAGAYVFRVCGVRQWDDPREPGAFRDCVTTDPFVLRYYYSSSGGDSGSDEPRPGESETPAWVAFLGLHGLDVDYYVASIIIKVALMVAVFVNLYVFFMARNGP